MKYRQLVTELGRLISFTANWRTGATCVSTHLFRQLKQMMRSSMTILIVDCTPCATWTNSVSSRINTERILNHIAYNMPERFLKLKLEALPEAPSKRSQDCVI